MKPSSPLYILWLLVLCAGVVACTTEGERRQMAQVIAEADSMNRNYVPMTSDSLLLQACAFYDRHGSPNERMKARYLLGCVYRDRQQAPEALEQYHKATLCADTTDHGCDFKCLSRIYSQMADLYDVQNMTETTLEMSSRAIYYARKCDDVDAVLALMSNCSACYYRLGEIDSALAVSFRVHDLFCQYHDTLSANTVLGPVIGIYLSQGEFVKVKPLLEKYEHHSFLTGNEHFKEQSYYYLYYYKGVCYTHSEKYDSASYCFRKQISEGTTLDNQKAGNLGLYRLYKKMGITDSISKYADICFSLNDSVASASVHTTLQQMQSLYDYSHYQKQSMDNAEKANRRMQIAIALLLVAFLAIAAAFYFRRRYMEKKHTLDKLKSEFAEATDRYDKNLQTLQALEDDHRAMIAQVKDELSEENARLKAKIEELVSQSGISSSVRKMQSFMESPIARRLMELRDKPLSPMTEQDREMLVDTTRQFYPSFLYDLQHAKNITPMGVCVGILSAMNFRSGDIANLLDLSFQQVSNIKKSISLALFNEKTARSLYMNLVKHYDFYQTSML